MLSRISTTLAAAALTTLISACFPVDPGEPTETGDRLTLCQNYCVEVMESCSGDFAQYPDASICVTHCNEWAAWNTGPEGNREFNDIECRLSHALSAGAGENVPANCERAGPTGGNACGTLCVNYCDMLARNCADNPEVLLPRDECLRQCGNLDQDGRPGDATGNTVQCRLHHLTLAAHSPPRSNQTHCPHGGIEPTAFCLDEGEEKTDHSGH
jgi:hypothetical protein